MISHKPFVLFCITRVCTLYCSVSCGKEFTVVACFPYEGPVYEVAQQLMEEFAAEDEEIALLEMQVQTHIDRISQVA